jgi:hypothetical protein
VVGSGCRSLVSSPFHGVPYWNAFNS